MRKFRELGKHLLIWFLAFLTLLPFFFVLNNSFRSNDEMYHSFFGLPENLQSLVKSSWAWFDGQDILFEIEDEDRVVSQVGPREATFHFWNQALRGYRLSWEVLRAYMLNTFFVCAVTAMGVVVCGSATAYVLSRYRFPGHQLFFYMIVSTMMFPGVLTLVPSFILIKQLGLLNTYWAMIIPYIAGGQVFATFIFKSFFDGLPEDLFESARIDGAGHLRLYLNIVVPLSKPVLSVVLIMNVLSTWNNFMWPFITNTDNRYHVIASGLYVMATSSYASNMSTLFAAYMVSSIPLMILFIYATKPFVQGVTSGAFKA